MAAPRDISLDIEILRRFISYDPVSGILTWIAPRQGVVVGSRAGSADKRGYVNIRFGAYRLLGHRVGWALTYGRWPSDQLDHRDLDPSHNWLSNLREATEAQNKANTGRHSDRLYDAAKGVYWDKRRSKWMASIYRNGKGQFIGYFDQKAEAAVAYARRSKEIDGEFSRAA
jgi:hypothetical protein